MAPTLSKVVNEDQLQFEDDNGMFSLCPKLLCDLLKSVDTAVNPELGISLNEVESGGLRHRVHKGKMKRGFFEFLNHDEKYVSSY